MNQHELLCLDCVKEAGLSTFGTSLTLKGWREHWEGRKEWLRYLQYVRAGCIVCKRTDENLRVTCVASLTVEGE